MAWTPEQDDALRAGLVKLESFSVIAADLSRLFGCYITRNAAIGRAGRLGLSGTKPRAAPLPRPAPRAPAIDFRKRAVVAQARGHRPQTELPDLPPPAIDTLDVPIEQHRSILDLGADDCRWPFGDPCTVEFYFCAGRVREGDSYCPHHCRLAYTGTGTRRHNAGTHRPI